MHVPSALLYLVSSSVIMYTNKQVMTTYGLVKRKFSKYV